MTGKRKKNRRAAKLPVADAANNAGPAKFLRPRS